MTMPTKAPTLPHTVTFGGNALGGGSEFTHNVSSTPILLEDEDGTEILDVLAIHWVGQGSILAEDPVAADHTNFKPNTAGSLIVNFIDQRGGTAKIATMAQATGLGVDTTIGRAAVGSSRFNFQSLFGSSGEWPIAWSDAV